MGGLAVAPKRDEFRRQVYESIYPKNILESRPFYNIGAGGFFHPYWTNIDYVSDWYAARQQGVIHHDLMSKSPLPIQTGSAKIVYTSHTIEHVKEDAVEVLFAEAFRCLEPGGIFRVTTGPDAETDFRALMNNDEHWFYWDSMYTKKGSYEKIFHRPATSVPLAERWLHHVASQLAANDVSPSPVKYTAPEIMEAIRAHGFPGVLDFFCRQCTFLPERPGNHISWWTHDKVMSFLTRAGFKTVYRSGYRQSSSPLLRKSALFDSTHPQMSLYVEAVR